MKTIPFVLALAALTAAGDAVAGRVEIWNCNSPGAWINAYAYNEKDAVRIVAASDVQGLQPGRFAVLTCATAVCSVTYEYPNYIGKDTTMSHPHLNYGFSGGGGASSNFVGPEDHLCTRLDYDAEGNLTGGVHTDTTAGCSCN